MPSQCVGEGLRVVADGQVQEEKHGHEERKRRMKCVLESNQQLHLHIQSMEQQCDNLLCVLDNINEQARRMMGSLIPIPITITITITITIAITIPIDVVIRIEGGDIVMAEQSVNLAEDGAMARVEESRGPTAIHWLDEQCPSYVWR